MGQVAGMMPKELVKVSPKLHSRPIANAQGHDQVPKGSHIVANIRLTRLDPALVKSRKAV
jgi:hypothetical protein